VFYRQQLAEHFTHASITLVPDASHWPQWDQPEVVARYLFTPST
jgi:pimeloyl-ACP methyl ester carboxylesterase